MLHFLAQFFGLDNASGPQYLFWSGFGSDLGEFTILVVLYRKLNCHTPGCFRIGLHHIDGTPFIVCRKHHPDIHDSHDTH